MSVGADKKVTNLDQENRVQKHTSSVEGIMRMIKGKYLFNGTEYDWVQRDSE